MGKAPNMGSALHEFHCARKIKSGYNVLTVAA